MIYLHTFLFYTCFASTVLIYGLGLTTTTELNFSKYKDFIYLFKIVLNISISSVLTWLVANYILWPLHLVELFPIVSFLIYVCFSIFIEALIRLTAGRSTSEFVFSFLVIILSVLESTSILNTLVIAGSCLVSVGIILPLVYSFKERLKLESEDSVKYYSRLFLFLAIIILAASFWDVMWINMGVVEK